MMQKIIAIVSTTLLSMVMLLSSIGSASAMPIVPLQSTTTMATIYIGNLSFQAEEEDINEIFAEYGVVERVAMSIDRESGKKRGFAFVEMSTEEQETAAIEELDGAEWMGRIIKVNKALPRENRR